MSRIRLPIGAAFLVAIFAVACPLYAQVKGVTGPTSTETGPIGAAGNGASSGGGGSGTSLTTTGPTLQGSPYTSVQSAPQVKEPPQVFAAPSADSGNGSCQCYRLERVPMVIDGQTSWSEQRVPNGTSPSCCP